MRDNCERVSYLDIDEQTFIERFERPNVPVVITDGQLDWQANKKWTTDRVKPLYIAEVHIPVM